MKPIKFLFLSLLATFSSVAFGQTVCPTAPNFMDLNSPCVVCNYGKTWDLFSNTGLANTRHTLITTQGFDPNTGHKLPFIPEGDSVSIRLGNPQIGAEAEAITYQFKVERDKALLSVRFAVVLEDPGHSFWEQPRFIVRILNEFDELVEDCAEYDVTAAAGIPGFETYYGMGTPIRWRPWSTVALDLSPYIGQNIKVQFITYDCSQSGHFGYAYFTAECLPNKLDLTSCANTNDTIRLSAPPFCESYKWTNGDTTASTMFIKQGSNPIAASCLITSATGCQFTLNAYLSNIPFANDTVICDTVCEGEPYTKNYFNLPPQYKIGTTSHINSFYNITTCSGMITALLNITVKQRCYPVHDAICYGENYNKYGFHIVKPAVGIIRDTLIFSRENNCDSIVFLTLTVSPSNLSSSKTILGNPTPCSGEVETYTLPDAEFFTSFSWTIPENINIIGNRNSEKIVLQFTDEAVADTLKLYAANGCGSKVLPLFVKPKISHYLSFVDSICTGLIYTENGFNIPRQDSAGFKIFSQNLSTQDGCDSVRMLFLTIFPSPEIEIQTLKDVICADDSVELHVASANVKFEILKAKVGDILCTDNSIETKDSFPTSGKTAQGVIFWIDPDETHCWVADLNQYYLVWGVDIIELSGVVTITSELLDTSGYQNTQAMRNAGDTVKYPSVWNIDFDNGWFLPAITQARILFGSIPFINESLSVAGGTPFDMHLYLHPTSFPYTVTLQSSTQYNAEFMWGILSSGYMYSRIYKRSPSVVRSIRYFQLNR